MEIADLTVPFSRFPYEMHLHGLCDVQEGSRSTLTDMVEYWIEQILADPCDSAVIIPGDLEDEDRPSTRARRAAAFADRPEVPERDADKHMAWLDKMVIPRYVRLHQGTKFGIIGVLAGHHWTQLTPAMNSVQYICLQVQKQTGKPVRYWGEMSAFLTLHFRQKLASGFGTRGVMKVGHIQHGEGGGQTKGSSLAKMDRTAQGFYADFYIRGHDCQIVAAKYAQLRPKDFAGSRTLM